MSDLSRPLTDDPKRLLPAHLERLPMPSQERKCYNLPFCLLLAAYWVGTCAQLTCTLHTWLDPVVSHALRTFTLNVTSNPT